VNPLSIDEVNPRLSWVCKSSQRGQKQSAYRLLVASSREKLNKNVGDLWDSGKVESDQSLNVVYSGKALASRGQYFWKARVWDSNGGEPTWSKPASWGMGIGSSDAWRGQWIQSDLSLYDYQVELKKVPDHELEIERMDDGRDIRVRAKAVRKMTAKVTEAPAVWMRKEFKSEGRKLRKATLFISGLGLYEAYLNGSKINDHLLNVSPHDFGKTVPYHVHDVTAHVKNGENALGVILGNGYFNPVIPSLLREYAFDFIDTPRLKCELQLEYENGSTQLVVSDTSWKFTTDGPIRFNSIRSGETYDARKELGNWSGAGFSDKNWKTARTAKAPQGRMRQRTLPPVRVIKTIPAVSVKAYKKGYRFDIGVDSTGWARMKLRGRKGQKIVIKYSGAGSHTLGRYQICEYICKGDGDEFFEPRFAFNGYRYVDVYGLDYTPAASDLVGRQVVSDLQTIGSFSCSDQRINTLQQVNLRTIRNYNVTMPMDPVREKVCWTQDVQTNFETSAYNYNLYAIYSKWQDDYIDSVLDNGFVPTVVPSCFDGPGINGPWWGGMLIYNPWQLYNFYGDKEILSKSYDAMKHHMSYYDSIAKNNIISWGLGDWMDLASGGHGQPRGTAVAYTSTCGYMLYADILQKTAVILNKKKDADYFAKRREEIRTAVNRTFYNDKTGSYNRGSQTSYILALKLGIPSKNNRARVVENFRKQVSADNDHLSTGFVGTPFLLTLLTEEGAGDLAWKIATQESYPSWYDMIFNKKNNVFKENWQGGLVQMPSLAGPIGAWFYRSLGGIRADEPGFKSFIVAPYTKTLDWVKCDHMSPYGKIVSNWSKKNGLLTMHITVPSNTTATVYVPGKSVTEGGLSTDEADGVTFLCMEKNKAVFKVQSGKYEFKSVVE
jgi:alpha-L-rhamnosidase